MGQFSRYPRGTRQYGGGPLVQFSQVGRRPVGFELEKEERHLAEDPMSSYSYQNGGIRRLSRLTGAIKFRSSG